jgi:hypothetical protein
MRSAFEEAHRDRAILEQRHGGEGAFTPAVDGTVAPARVEAFLAVRGALAYAESRIEGVDGEFARFEALTDEGEPKLTVALPAVVRLTRSMLRLPSMFGEIEKARNRALVEADMSLGEYAYLYVVAYHDQLVDPEIGTHLFGSSAANGRVRAELRETLRRQLAGVESEPDKSGEFVNQLAAEVAALENDPDRIPWQDGVPERIAESFTPYRDRLDAAYSPAGAELELLNSNIRHGGFTIEMN